MEVHTNPNKALKTNFYQRLRKNSVKILEISKRFQFLSSKYEKYKDFLDTSFEKRLVGGEFNSRLTELYFIEALVESGLHIQHKGDCGPDIWINDISGWGEFVAATELPERQLRGKPFEVRNVDLDEPLVRISSVLSTKSKKLKMDITKGIVKADEPIVLFVSTRQLRDPYPMNPEGQLSSFARAVFPLNKPTLTFYPDSHSSSWSYEFDPGLKKNETTKIENNYFISKDNSHISAVVFSYSSIFDEYFSPNHNAKSGDDFVVIHNPRASNPITSGLFNCSEEYECSYDGDVLSITNVKTNSDESNDK